MHDSCSQRSPLKTKRLLLIGATCGVLATLALFAKTRRNALPHLPPTAATRPAEATPVRIMTVKEQPMQETIMATGTLRADESVEVRAEISGKLMKIHFQEGSAVRAGELLVSINDAELRASLQRAVYRRELADLKTSRLSTLRNLGGVTQQDFDIAVSELNVLTAEVAVIEAQLAHTEIRAPFDGVVGLRSVSEGAFVTPATRIATFQRLDRLKVDFSVPERYAPAISLDNEVTITVAGSNQPLVGRIYAIEPLVDAATRTMQIRAICSNPSGRQFAGGFVSVKLNLASIPAAILVPSLAVAPGAADQSVFVVENGQARRRVVRTGTRSDSAVQIIEGLSPGDLVIVSGLQQIRPGQAVRPATDAAESTGPTPSGRRIEHQAATATLN